MPVALTPPDAKAALLVELRASSALQGVQVEWAHPGKNIAAECLYFGDTTYDQQPAALGNRNRNESYTLELIVTVEKRGNDPEAAERRVWAFLGAVYDVLLADPDLGGDVRVAQYSASPVRNFAGEGKRVSEAVVSIGVTAEV